LPSDLLLKLDRTTMHNGIEGRVPFLDDQFAPYAFALPDSLKVHQQGGHDYGKYILRQHLDAKGLGEMAWARKQGFSVAVGTFMAEKPKLLAALWGESALLREILRPGATALLGRLGHAKSANLAFSLTLLALWEKLHVEVMEREELAARLSGIS
jgi:asparagine synthase (glutamine-hydrolysing)